MAESRQHRSDERSLAPCMREFLVADELPFTRSERREGPVDFLPGHGHERRISECSMDLQRKDWRGTRSGSVSVWAASHTLQETMADLVRDLNEQMCSGDNKREPWLLLLDPLPLYCSTQFRTFMKEAFEHIVLCFIVAGTTGSCQRAFKLHLHDLSSRHLAPCALRGQNGSVLQVVTKAVLKASLVKWVGSPVERVVQMAVLAEGARLAQNGGGSSSSLSSSMPKKLTSTTTLSQLSSHTSTSRRICRWSELRDTHILAR